MLTINYNSTDLSLKLAEFEAPGVAITLLENEYVYIGYHKPFNNVHIEFTEEVQSLSNITLEYETNSGFTSVSDLIDRTNGLGNSGKVSWSEVKNNTQSKSTRFGKELFWYRLSVNIATEERTILGIGVLFSSDSDLKQAYPGIEAQLPDGHTSFVNFHVDARKDIVQELRKKYTSNGNLLTEFDLLNNAEVNSASKYLTLSKIFGWLSDAPGDKWEIKEEKFKATAYSYISTITLTVDTNDNGKTEEVEKAQIQFAKVIRV